MGHTFSFEQVEQREKRFDYGVDVMPLNVSPVVLNEVDPFVLADDEVVFLRLGVCQEAAPVLRDNN